ncbi:MAG: oligosaccharide flippase family protein [Bacteroidota bacterium]
MAALRNLLGQTAIYGVSSIVGRVMNFFILTPFYTRIFDKVEYGAITELYAYVAFLLVFLTYGMETAFFRFSSKEKSKAHLIFSTAAISLLTTSCMFIGLIYLSHQNIADFLGYSSSPEFIILFGWIVAIDTFVTLPFAQLRLQNKAVRFASINLVSIVVNITLNLFFFKYCPAAVEAEVSWVESFYEPSFGIGYVFVANFIASLAKLLLLLPTIAGIKTGFSPRVFKQLLPYGLPLLFLGLAGIVNETFDRAAFESLSGLPPDEAAAELGIYGACYKVAMLLSIGIQAYRFAAEPFIFSLSKGEKSDKVQADAMKYYFISALLICLTLICFEDLSLLLIGEEFRVGAGVIPILLGAYLLYGAVFNLSFWYKLNDKTLYGAGIAFAGAAITIALNVWLVPKMSYYGSAIATLAAYAVMVVISFALMRKYHPIAYDLKSIGIYLTLAALMVVAFKFAALDGGLKYVAGFICVGVFALFAFIKEKKLILSNDNRRNHK